MCELLHIVRPNLPVESCKIAAPNAPRQGRGTGTLRTVVFRWSVLLRHARENPSVPASKCRRQSAAPDAAHFFLLWRILVTSGHRVSGPCWQKAVSAQHD